MDAIADALVRSFVADGDADKEGEKKRVDRAGEIANKARSRASSTVCGSWKSSRAARLSARGGRVHRESAGDGFRLRAAEARGKRNDEKGVETRPRADRRGSDAASRAAWSRARKKPEKPPPWKSRAPARRSASASCLRARRRPTSAAASLSQKHPGSGESARGRPGRRRARHGREALATRTTERARGGRRRARFRRPRFRFRYSSFPATWREWSSRVGA